MSYDPQTGLFMVTSGFNIQGYTAFNSELDDAFRTLYFGMMTNNITFSNAFIKASESTFEQIAIPNNITDVAERADLARKSDSYFTNFTPIVLKFFASGQYNMAFGLWQEIISITRSWEEKNPCKGLHKGTPHYFASVAALLSNNFDAAFMSMHLALEEDKQNNPNYKSSPAYYLLSLDESKSDSYLQPYIQGVSEFLTKRLDSDTESYSNKRNGNLPYQNFRSKFFDNQNIQEELKFFFVYSLMRLWHLRVLHKNKIGDNLIAPVIFAQALGGLLIGIEDLLKATYKDQKSLGSVLPKFFKDQKWGDPKISELNQQKETDFDKWVDDSLAENSMVGDFKLVYGLRNHAFHTIKSQQKLWNNYTQVLQSTLNVLFKSIEIL